MKILFGMEESQTLVKQARKRGHDAYSCDLLPCSGGHPEWHIQGDLFENINAGWDMLICHPPCTFVANSGSQWLSHPDDKNLPFENRRPNPFYPDRRKDMYETVEMIKRIWACKIPKLGLENPIGKLSTIWKPWTQICHPWQFGDEATKPTCLWLRGLPNLMPTKIVGKGERTVFSSGKSHPKMVR